MNPQPPEYVGSLCALLFLGVMFFYALKAYMTDTEDYKLNDLFVLGYVDESNPVVNVTVQREKSIESTQIFIDCVDALYALGMKKNAAKRKAREVFEKLADPPSSVQEFLMIALSK